MHARTLKQLLILFLTLTWLEIPHIGELRAILSTRTTYETTLQQDYKAAYITIFQCF